MPSHHFEPFRSGSMSNVTIFSVHCQAFLPPQLYIFARALPFPRVLPYNRHMEFKYFKNMLVVSGVKPFDLEKCCTCGQAFRWVKNPVHMQAGLFDECGLPDAEASLCVRRRNSRTRRACYAIRRFAHCHSVRQGRSTAFYRLF